MLWGLWGGCGCPRRQTRCPWFVSFRSVGGFHQPLSFKDLCNNPRWSVEPGMERGWRMASASGGLVATTLFEELVLPVPGFGTVTLGRRIREEGVAGREDQERGPVGVGVHQRHVTSRHVVRNGALRCVALPAVHCIPGSSRMPRTHSEQREGTEPENRRMESFVMDKLISVLVGTNTIPSTRWNEYNTKLVRGATRPQNKFTAKERGGAKSKQVR